MMRKLSKKTLWIILTLAFILAIALVFLCTIAEGAWLYVILVLLAIDFIFLTIGVQAASFQTFKYNPKKRKFDTLDYNGDYYNLRNLLKQNKYKERKTLYGYSFIKVDKEFALKCVLVDNFNEYFNQLDEVDENNTSNNDLDKCSKFVGIEIFKEIDEINIDKLPDFSLQGKNIYYTALLNQDNNLLKCLNFIEPNDEFKAGYEKLIDDLKITVVEDRINEEQYKRKN